MLKIYTLILGDIEAELRLPTNSNLSILKEIVPDYINFSCKSGCCGSCIIKVIKGGKNLTKINNKEQMILQKLNFAEENYRLGCQCNIIGNAIIEKPNRERN